MVSLQIKPSAHGIGGEIPVLSWMKSKHVAFSPEKTFIRHFEN